MEKSRETKSLLAKLMAAENINVEYHTGADTAAFSTETRTLIMPVLKDITENSTDLFLQINANFFAIQQSIDHIQLSKK